MLMLDLCSGLGGASQAMRQRRWQVVTVDNDPSFKPDIVADLKSWSWDGPKPDLIWASPPCTEFSKFSMQCWYNPAELPAPNMSLLRACKRIIGEVQPKYWVLENVLGAVSFFEPVLGPPALILNPYYLWGHFPDLGRPKGWGNKYDLSSTAKAQRAAIPIQISTALAMAVETQQTLW